MDDEQAKMICVRLDSLQLSSDRTLLNLIQILGSLQNLEAKRLPESDEKDDPGLVPCRVCGQKPVSALAPAGTDYPFTYQYSCPRKEPCCVGLVGNNLFSLVDRWNKINSKEPAASATEL